MEPQNTTGAAPAAAGSATDASAGATQDPKVLDEAARARAATLGINVDDFHVITEGKASILFPKENQVFYNPVQEYNRDLSIMMLKLLIEDLRKTAGIFISTHFLPLSPFSNFHRRASRFSFLQLFPFSSTSSAVIRMTLALVVHFLLFHNLAV
jgi:tRNA G26 N,N-dimethylase Trm1